MAPPRVENPRVEMMCFMATEDEKLSYLKAADKAGVSFSAWVRDLLNNYIKESNRE